MEEEAVGLLQLVQIGNHLFGVAVEIRAISGGAISLELQHGEHVHVVDPEARFSGEPVGLRILPLAVRPPFALGQILWILGLDGDLQGNDAEDGVVYMAPLRPLLGIGAVRE